MTAGALSNADLDMFEDDMFATESAQLDSSMLSDPLFWGEDSSSIAKLNPADVDSFFQQQTMTFPQQQPRSLVGAL